LSKTPAETTGRDGRRAASAVGIALLGFALVIFATGWAA
jgi:hypothetical protein